LSCLVITSRTWDNRCAEPTLEPPNFKTVKRPSGVGDFVALLRSTFPPKTGEYALAPIAAIFVFTSVGCIFLFFGMLL
jgi:hypothetical protein